LQVDRYRQAVEIAAREESPQGHDAGNRGGRISASLMLRDEQDGQWRLVDARCLTPAKVSRGEAKKAQLLAQGLRRRVVFGGYDHDLTQLLAGIFAFDNFVGLASCRGDWRFVAAKLGQDNEQLPADGICLIVRDGMHRTVTEQGQCRVLQFLAGADQPRQVMTVELLGQAIERQGEFDKKINFALGAIIFPTRFQCCRQCNADERCSRVPLRPLEPFADRLAI